MPSLSQFKNEAARLAIGQTITFSLEPARTRGWVFELRNILTALLSRPRGPSGLMSPRSLMGSIHLSRFFLKRQCRRALVNYAPEHPLRDTLERYLVQARPRQIRTELLSFDALPDSEFVIDIPNFFIMTRALGLKLKSHSAAADSLILDFQNALETSRAPKSVQTRFREMNDWEKLSLLDELCELQCVLRFTFVKTREQSSDLPEMNASPYFTQGSQRERMRDGLAQGLRRLDPEATLSMKTLASILGPRVSQAGQIVPGLSSGDLIRELLAQGRTDDEIRSWLENSLENYLSKVSLAMIKR